MGVYVHIPFCEHKCSYCDFHSIVVGDAESFSRLVDSYLVSLRREALYYRELWGERPLQTLFLAAGPQPPAPGEAGIVYLLLRQELPLHR